MSTVPPSLSGLVDDAAVFPPGDAPLDQAVAAHRRHREAGHADLVGPLVVADRHLPDLVRLVEPVEPPLECLVVVSGGAGAVEPTAVWAAKAGVGLRGLEVAVRESDAGDPATNLRRLLAAHAALEDDVPLAVEVPRLHDAEPGPSWLGVLDELAAADHTLKLRTGGLEAAAFPSSHELATCLVAALDRELRFKCTAGLHRALRHRDDETGFEHHGFLNVLVATRASLDGADDGEVAAVLDETDAEALLGRTDETGLASAHRWFTSFGSCSVLEPLADLRALGLVSA